jgi:hypothetical protein
MVAGIAEEDPQPADGSASGYSNGSSAAPEDRSDDWQRVPEDASDASTVHTSPVTGVPPDQVQAPVARPGESESAPVAVHESRRPIVTHRAAATSAPSIAIAAPASRSAIAAPTEQPSDAALTGPPPALDVSTISTSRDLGTIALDHEIQQAASPARAASLRLTEQARKELASGAMDGALRDLARAVSIDAGDPFEYYYLGRAYFLRRNYPQALTFFQRSRLGFGGRPEWLGETLSYEGMCDEELGKPEDAARAYQHAISIAPGNFRARIGYGRLSASIAPPTSLDSPPPDEQGAPPAPSADAAAPPPAQSSVPPTE